MCRFSCMDSGVIYQHLLRDELKLIHHGGVDEKVLSALRNTVQERIIIKLYTSFQRRKTKQYTTM